MIAAIKQQIDRIKARGATYLDARYYPFEESNQLFMQNGNLKNASSSGESGVGVRVLYKGAWGFSASSDMSDLAGLFDRAFEIIGQRRETGFADTGIGLYKSMSLLQFSDQQKRGSTAAEQVAISRIEKSNRYRQRPSWNRCTLRYTTG